jgi:hypothetical protein
LLSQEGFRLFCVPSASPSNFHYLPAICLILFQDHRIPYPYSHNGHTAAGSQSHSSVQLLRGCTSSLWVWSEAALQDVEPCQAAHVYLSSILLSCFLSASRWSWLLSSNSFGGSASYLEFSFPHILRIRSRSSLVRRTLYRWRIFPNLGSSPRYSLSS